MANDTPNQGAFTTRTSAPLNPIRPRRRGGPGPAPAADFREPEQPLPAAASAPAVAAPPAPRQATSPVSGPAPVASPGPTPVGATFLAAPVTPVTPYVGIDPVVEAAVAEARKRGSLTYQEYELDVTPAIAMEMLSRTVCNPRPFYPSNTRGFVAIIEGKQWVLTHQGLALDKCEPSCVLDGRHRLKAVIESGVTVRFKVTEGVPKEYFPAIDTGKARSNKDITVIETGSRLYATTRAAAVRALWLHDLWKAGMGDGWESWNKGRMSPYIAQEATRQYPLDDEYLKNLANVAKKASMSHPAVVFAHYLAHRACPDADHAEFLRGLETGAMLPTGDPRLALRNTMQDSKETKSRVRPSAVKQAAMYLKAWNEFVTGKAGRKLMSFKGGQGGEDWPDPYAGPWPYQPPK